MPSNAQFNESRAYIDQIHLGIFISNCLKLFMVDDRVISAMARTLECLKSAFKFPFTSFKAYLHRIHLGILISDPSYCCYILSWSKRLVCFAKQDPGRARQSIKVEAGRKFLQPHTSFLVNPCTSK